MSWVGADGTPASQLWLRAFGPAWPWPAGPQLMQGLQVFLTWLWAPAWLMSANQWVGCR